MRYIVRSVVVRYTNEEMHNHCPLDYMCGSRTSGESTRVGEIGDWSVVSWECQMCPYVYLCK